MEEKKPDRKEQLANILAEWKEFFCRRKEEVVKYTKNKPGTALGIAFALGLYLGRGIWKR